MSRHTRADICHNVRHITITSKDPNAFWNNSNDPENWSHNGWSFPEEAVMAGDKERLYCDVLAKGDLTVKLINQDANWNDCFVLCSDSAGSITSFLTDWAADIESGEFITVDAVWQTI